MEPRRAARDHQNLSIEFAYVGSHIVHVGIPDSNLNQLTAAQLAQGSSLLTAVANPYYGQLPISSSIGGKTVSQAQLLKPYPRFLNVATYRNNSGNTNYNAGEVKVEQRFDRGLALALRLHSLAADRRCVVGVLNHRALLSQFQQPHRGRHLPSLA